VPSCPRRRRGQDGHRDLHRDLQSDLQTFPVIQRGRGSRTSRYPLFLTSLTSARFAGVLLTRTRGTEETSRPRCPSCARHPRHPSCVTMLPRSHVARSHRSHHHVAHVTAPTSWRQRHGPHVKVPTPRHGNHTHAAHDPRPVAWTLINSHIDRVSQGPAEILRVFLG
jgi:hypothetical protein